MSRRHAHPPTWELDTYTPYPQAVACGDLAVTRGQLDFDMSGKVRNVLDARAQNLNVVRHAERAFAELGVPLSDCVKVVVFFESSADEDLLMRDIAAEFGESPPVIVPVPLPGFPLPGTWIESEFIASNALPRRALVHHHLGYPQTEAVRAGDTIFVGRQLACTDAGEILFPGDPVSQLEVVRERLARALSELGVDLDDVVRLMTFYVSGGDASAWPRLATQRARWFQRSWPVITDVPVPRLSRPGAVLAVDAIAIRHFDGARDRTDVSLPGLGSWPIELPHPPAIRCADRMFIGGRQALTRQGTVVQPGVMEYQTRYCMEEITQLLHAGGMALSDVMKVNAYYIGHNGSTSAMDRNFPIRAAYFAFPGPASTGTYFSEQAIPGATITIEMLAMKADR